MTCKDCHRPLTDPVSVARGYGPECWAKHHPADGKPVHVLWSSAQMELFEGSKGGQDEEMEVVHVEGMAAFQIVDDQDRKDEGRRYRVRNRNSLLALLGQAIGIRHGPIIRYPIRAPWWRRLWRWVRGGVR